METYSVAVPTETYSAAVPIETYSAAVPIQNRYRNANGNITGARARELMARPPHTNTARVAINFLYLEKCFFTIIMYFNNKSSGNR